MSFLKKIDILIIKGFLGPYIVAFFVAEFVLVMQFLWKYIDEIVGKGFSFWYQIELIFYYAITLIPLALPIAVLIASVMVYGNLAERYELSSMKSAGVSLLRIMKPGIMIAVLTASFSLFASNYLKTKANYKFFERFSSIKRQKPSLGIEAQMFNKDFKGYVIRVGEKDKDGRSIEDILIYDQTNPDRSLINLTTADSGIMYTTREGDYFVMQLNKGEQYREMKRKLKPNKGGPRLLTYPFLRMSFSSWEKVFDMSEFEASERTINLNRNKHDLMNSFQLLAGIDSMDLDIKKLVDDARDNFGGIVLAGGPQKSKLDIDNELRYKNIFEENQSRQQNKTSTTTKTKTQEIKLPNELQKNLQAELQKLNDAGSNSKYPVQTSPDADRFYKMFASQYQYDLVETGRKAAKVQRDRSFSVQQKVRELQRSQSKYRLRLNQQFSWALVCIIFLFIGAPLGSIVRKGGYGYPLLFAIIFFMIFIIMQIFGEKLHRSQLMNEYLAAWIPCLILLPIAIYLTYKALLDSKLLGINVFFRKYFS